jgi:ribonucleoside-diphosphate reductase alpha chain
VQDGHAPGLAYEDHDSRGFRRSATDESQSVLPFEGDSRAAGSPTYTLELEQKRASRPTPVAKSSARPSAAVTVLDTTAEKVRQARLKGYEGDPCGSCGLFTLVRNGFCLKCDTCGETTGCS